MALLRPLADGDFIYFSRMRKAPVLREDGARLGLLADVIVDATVEPYPPVRSLLVRGAEQRMLEVPWRAARMVDGGFRVVEPQAVAPLGQRIGTFGPEAPVPLGEGRLALAADLLDRQIVDTHGAKVRRVNDLYLLMAEGKLYLVHVDVGFRGLVRRMGIERPVDGLVKRLRPASRYLGSEGLVPWRHVQVTAPGGDPARVRLDIAGEELARLHPADLADILEELAAPSRQALFESLPVEAAAETLGEIEDAKMQAELLERVGDERAAEIIEAMDTDEAADVLGELPEEKAQEILGEMDQAEAADVRKLLAYAEDTAGGLMSTELLTLPPDTRSPDALLHVRQAAREVDFAYYVYVVTSSRKLVSVLSLRELLLLEDDKTVGEGGTHDVVSVRPDDSLEHASEVAAKYALLAVPVLDDSGVLLGIVTVDDLLERVIEAGGARP